MATDKTRQQIIDDVLMMMASRSNPTVVEIAERVKRRYYI